MARREEEGLQVREAAQGASAAGPHVNGFGLRLLSALSPKSANNVCISPVSLAMALVVLRAGAAGRTASEIDRALGIGADDDLSEAFSRLADFLLDGQVDCELRLASCLWPDRSVPLKDEFLARVRRQFRSDVQPLDLAGEPGKCVSVINKWVRRETNGLIPEILSQIDREAVFVLTNAIYFRSPWASPFERALPGDFRLDKRLGESEGTIEVPMLRETARPEIRRKTPTRNSSSCRIARPAWR